MTRIITNYLGLDWVYDIEDEPVKPGKYTGRLISTEFTHVYYDELPVIDKKPKQKAPNHRRPERKLRRGK